MKIAFLGLGIMGRPMAANLVKAGHEVTVWNRTPGKIVEGARIAATPAEAAKGCDVVWMCVADTNAVEQVLFGPQGVCDSMAPGMIIADSSTILPSATEKFAARVREMQCSFVDAPVTGSKAGAENGTLVFMVGGDEPVVAKLQPLFDAMGSKVLYIGKNGKGSAIKIAMNMMNAMIFEGFAEGLTLARKLGVEPEKMLELVQSSMIRSGVVDFKGPYVLKRDFSPHFPLRLMHKDIRLNLEAARAAGVRLPALEQVEKIYVQSTEDGMKDLDYIATIEILEKMAGMQPELAEKK